MHRREASPVPLCPSMGLVRGQGAESECDNVIMGKQHGRWLAELWNIHVKSQREENQHHPFKWIRKKANTYSNPPLTYPPLLPCLCRKGLDVGIASFNVFYQHWFLPVTLYLKLYTQNEWGNAPPPNHKTEGMGKPQATVPACFPFPWNKQPLILSSENSQGLANSSLQ